MLTLSIPLLDSHPESIRLEADSGTYTHVGQIVQPYSSSGSEPTCFGLPTSQAQPFTAGSFVASVAKGASINCPVVTSLCPHSNGTHTECIGHALYETVTLHDIGFVPPFLSAILLTVEPIEYLMTQGEEYYAAVGSDRVITGELLDASFQRLVKNYQQRCSSGSDLLFSAINNGALAIRTFPNDMTKKGRDWTGSNPPFFTESAAKWLLKHNVKHVLVDLPSFDKEDDGGKLIAHRTFWELDLQTTPPLITNTMSKRTITELCFFPNSLKDDLYILNLQVSDFVNYKATYILLISTTICRSVQSRWMLLHLCPYCSPLKFISTTKQFLFCSSYFC